MQTTQPIITVDNYLDFLPSEFIESFISDIEVAEKLNRPMDMGSYTQKDAKKFDTVTCLPCLGGMACMNLGLKYEYQSEFRDLNTELPLANRIAGIGNSIRIGDTLVFYKNLREIYTDLPDELTIKFCDWFIHHDITLRLFYDVVHQSEFKHLKQQVSYYVKALKSIGY